VSIERTSERGGGGQNVGPSHRGRLGVLIVEIKKIKFLCDLIPLRITTNRRNRLSVSGVYVPNYTASHTGKLKS
jgi:hypothetical protein